MAAIVGHFSGKLRWVMGVLILTILLVGGWPLLSINLWSLAYLRDTSAAPAPAGHRSATRWQVATALAQGRVGDASPYRQTLEAQRTDPLAQQVLGQLYLAQGDTEAALATWIAIGDVTSLLTAGHELQLHGQHQTAYRFFNAAWNINRERTAGPLADFLLAIGDTRAAIRTLEQAMQSTNNSRLHRQWQRRLDELQKGP